MTCVRATTLYCFLYFIITVAGKINDTPGSRVHMDTRQKQTDYLTRYQYMGEKCPDARMRELSKSHPNGAFTRAVAIFQRRMGLTPTGQVDQKTQELMEKPRCGNPDIVTAGDMTTDVSNVTSHRSKRYTHIHFIGWTKTALTYSVDNYPRNRLSQQQVLDAISQAFQAWADVTPLTFRRVEYNPDITIGFYSGYHGDSYPFDGPSGQLAHALVPAYPRPLVEATVHYDNSETWTLDDRSQTVKDLFQIAVHEFGHALGLGHSQFPSAVMYAVYTFREDFALSSDDVEGIQALYGENFDSDRDDSGSETAEPSPEVGSPELPRVTAASTSQGPEIPNANSFCLDTTIDAIMYHVTNYNFNGQYTVFKGSEYVTLTNGQIADGYPKPISQRFHMTRDVSAAMLVLGRYRTVCVRYWYYWCSRYGRVLFPEATNYIFTGDDVYTYSYGVFQGVAKISTVFPGIPSPVDAAFADPDYNLCFIQGDQYWVVPNTRGRPSSQYPKRLSDSNSIFRRLGVTSIEAALFGVDSFGRIANYIFKDGTIYKLDVRLAEVLQTASVSDDLYGCNQVANLGGQPFHRRNLISNETQSAMRELTMYVDQDGNTVDPDSVKDQMDNVNDYLENGQSKLSAVVLFIVFLAVIQYLV